MKMNIGNIYSLDVKDSILFIGGEKTLAIVNLETVKQLRCEFKQVKFDGSKISGIFFRESSGSKIVVCGFLWDTLLIKIDLNEFDSKSVKHINNRNHKWK